MQLWFSYNYFLAGRGLVKLNHLLKKPWFELKIRKAFLIYLLLEAAVIMHAICVTDKIAWKKDINKVRGNWYSKAKVELS